ncbi:MAG: hypothetical protein ACK5TO_07185 [Planctomycetaceae bacterium]
MPDLLPCPASTPVAPPVPPAPLTGTGWRRLKTALGSLLSVPLHPLGKLSRFRVAPFRHEARRADGLTVILPGIEGESLLNHDIVLGLVDAGLPGAIQIDDWTSGHPALGLWHLWDRRRHQREARRIAERLIEQHHQHPHAPIHLIGHSGGGAMVLLVLEQLPETVQVSTATLLNAAVSRTHDLTRSLARLERGLWNFSAVGDWFFVTLGTLLCRSLDGVHTVCAGAWGFTPPRPSPGAWPGLHERPWNWRDVGRGHGGGHFGCTNRLFVTECVAPILHPSAAAAASLAGGAAASRSHH